MEELIERLMGDVAYLRQAEGTLFRPIRDADGRATGRWRWKHEAARDIEQAIRLIRSIMEQQPTVPPEPRVIPSETKSGSKKASGFYV